MGRQMEVDEALTEVASLARTCLDDKTKLSALRTVLECHGVLSGAPKMDRKDLMRQVRELASAIRAGSGSGSARLTVRERERTSERETTAEIELSSQPTTAPGSPRPDPPVVDVEVEG